jgi:hypothetical protein
LTIRTTTTTNTNFDIDSNIDFDIGEYGGEEQFKMPAISILTIIHAIYLSLLSILFTPTTFFNKVLKTWDRATSLPILLKDTPTPQPASNNNNISTSIMRTPRSIRKSRISATPRNAKCALGNEMPMGGMQCAVM